MANLYCERCGESQEQKVWYESNVRPNLIMCSTECVYNHLDEIENGEWDNYEGGNLRLEYANEIKNNWIGLHIQEHIQEEVSND